MGIRDIMALTLSSGKYQGEGFEQASYHQKAFRYNHGNNQSGLPIRVNFAAPKHYAFAIDEVRVFIPSYLQKHFQRYESNRKHSNARLSAGHH